MKKCIRSLLVHEIDKVKGSRFIAFASPVASATAKDALKSVSDIVHQAQENFPTAGHHCYGYRILNSNNQLEEYGNDDGEPHGTAGIPILRQLQSHELINSVVVVSRIFGGVKLGTGGLVRAYGAAAQQSISQCALQDNMEPFFPRRSLRLQFPHSYTGVVRGVLHAHPSIQIGDTQYLEHVEMQVRVPVESVDEIKGILTECGNGRILVT